jgi:hypothetical protein
MGSIRGSNQGPIITQRYLNTATYAGDPTPGAVVSTEQVSGSIVQPYAGQSGAIMTLDEADAAYYSDPAYQQLYGGDYQYVQFNPSMSDANAFQGQVVFWVNSTTGLLNGGCLVTADYHGATNPVAGIALENTVKGNWWWIQTAGIAQVKFAGTLGATTPAVGDLVFTDYSGGTSNAYDPLQSSTGLTLAQLKQVLGIAWGSAPAALTISPVMLGGLDNPKYFPASASGGQ